MRSGASLDRLARCGLVVALELGIIGVPRPARAQDIPFLVKDINPGPDTSYPSELTEMNGRLFLTAHISSEGNTGLWSSDGTAAGTVLVGNIIPPGSYGTSFAAGL